MNLREIAKLVGTPQARRPAYESCNSVWELRALAQRRIPRPVFDYVEGGAEQEFSARENLRAYRRRQFRPMHGRDVSSADSSTTLFGRRLSLPLICSATGYSRMMHPDGELAVARAAERAGVAYVLSTMASTSIEDVGACGVREPWFQLYIWRDRGLTHAMLDRAWEAGYRVLEITLDTAVSGLRIRDLRNGFTIPPQLTYRSLGEIALKPRYWAGALSSPPIQFANLTADAGHGDTITIESISSLFDPTVTWDDVAEMCDRWPGQVLVKGSFDPTSAGTAIAAGAAGVHLSNHGGRQLDRVVPPIDCVAQIRQALGDEPVIVVDSGMRSGADLAIAVALGADAGAIGRAYLYGLMAGGEPGVDRALALIAREFKRTLQLLGVVSVAELREFGEQLVGSGRPPGS